MVESERANANSNECAAAPDASPRTHLHLIDVDLEEDRARVLVAQLVVDRRDVAARAAPGRREVHHELQEWQSVRQLLGTSLWSGRNECKLHRQQAVSTYGSLRGLGLLLQLLELLGGRDVHHAALDRTYAVSWLSIPAHQAHCMQRERDPRSRRARRRSGRARSRAPTPTRSAAR